MQSPDLLPKTCAVRNATIILPAELWLIVLEQTSSINSQHLWTVVRFVSRDFKNLAERIYVSTHLPRLAISLALPRRDPTTSALVWPGFIPHARLILCFDKLASNPEDAIFTSPETLGKGQDLQSLEDLKLSNVLPKKRLQEAAAWVSVNGVQGQGASMMLSRDIAWDEERKLWTWELDWKRLVSQFFALKERKYGNTRPRRLFNRR
ncbi:hypothetical protein EK21DRAFT_70920 [Setomelanomma holmii]|uniref:Uncharacterized protein n=1 Tax=Setomelanomma holmii TaxID=210430 RepID=A0A9P4LJQ9_9PLEO|nr:hypothetical protein EK21DRAFT_70920 [Setomelanomma holmii]